MSEREEPEQGSDGIRETRLNEIRQLEKKLVRMKHDLVETAASVTDEMESGEEATFLLLTIANRDFTIPISYVEEVVQMTKVSFLPEEVWGVTGLVNYHGEMIAIVDLGEIVGLEKGRVDADKTMIICLLESVRFALMVDETIDVVTVQRENIQVSGELLPGVLKAIGVLRTSGKAAIIIDVWSIALSVQLGDHGGNISFRKDGRPSNPAEALRVSKPPET